MAMDPIERLKAASDRNALKLVEAREAGRRVVGHYCLYSPVELVLAAGAIPVPLCGTRAEPIPAAEEILPRNLCPLIKSSFGFAVTDTCPFLAASDLLVADTTCDGKKKMFELLAAYKPIHVLQLPQNQDPLSALPYWRNEIVRLKERLEREVGVVIGDGELRQAIRLLNRERELTRRLMDTARADRPPLTGHEMLGIMHRLGFFPDKAEGDALLGSVVEELEARVAAGESSVAPGRPRILLTGVPVGLGSDKAVRLIEEAGGLVVVFESCGGYKHVFQVDEDGDPIEAIARAYLATPCSVMSPNPGRLELIERLCREFRADGVIDLTWQGCHTYNIESYTVKRFVGEQLGLPFLQLETDYSESDTGQLKVRLEAFIEMLG